MFSTGYTRINKGFEEYLCAGNLKQEKPYFLNQFSYLIYDTFKEVFLIFIFIFRPLKGEC